MTEESKKRGFYPISWRVIGGGVLIGNPKSKGADFDDVSDDLDDPQLSDALSVKVDFPKSDEDVFSLSNFKPRPRASSIPSTPSVSHVYAQSVSRFFYIWQRCNRLPALFGRISWWTIVVTSGL